MKIITQSILCRGLKTSWLEAGSSAKPILLFIHGFPDNASVWEKQIHHFAKDFHVIAPFLRGTAASPLTGNSLNPMPARLRMNAICLDIMQIISHTRHDKGAPIFIIGHDIGSLIAWNLADYLKDRVTGLVIINGASSPQFFWRLINTPEQILHSWYMFPFVVPYFPEIVLPLLGKTTYNVINRLYQNADIHKSQHKLDDQNTVELVKHYRSMLKHNLLSLKHDLDLPRVDFPVLSISGKNDPFILPASLTELESLTKRPIVRIIEGGHWLQEDKSDHVNRLLENFFNDENKNKKNIIKKSRRSPGTKHRRLSPFAEA